LNYGCGSWSHSLMKLREEGYQVYGYEPYSKDLGNPYIISDRAALAQMKFEGIFSNDVLEHFMDPAAELRFMKSLLSSEDACMAHTTGCYNYAYEYTRFHTFFFTGKSLEYICKDAGLKIVGEIDDPSPRGELDFYCRIYKAEE